MNEGLLEELGILARYYKKTNDHWRLRAYQQAILSIKNLGFRITDISQLGGARGVGKRIKEKIYEYLETGQISKAQSVKSQLQQKVQKTEQEAIIELFQGVWGVGPAKANELYQANVRSLQQLREHQHLLTNNQRIGLKYYQELLQPLSHDFIAMFELLLRTVLTVKFGEDTFRLKISGSYRRGKATSGDIDCLITSPVFNLNQMVRALQDTNVITDVLSMRTEKFMGIARCPSGSSHHFRMDIEYLPKDEWGSGLLYFTGSKAFNVSMRADAKRKGMILNQHGLFEKSGQRIPVYSEREIMEALDMKYVPPQNR